MLDIYELEQLEEDLCKELNDNLTGILTNLNRSGRLEDFLSMIGLSKLLKQEPEYTTYKNGKIVILGQSDVKEKDIIAIAKQYGITKDRLELCLDYEEAKKFNIGKMQWDPKYSVVLAGPMPHSGIGKGDYSSKLTAIESEAGYPPVKRLGSNSLKITKSGLKEALEALLNDGLIIA